MTYPQEPIPSRPSTASNPSPAPKTRRTLWIVLAVCGGMLALCCCGGTAVIAVLRPAPAGSRTASEHSPATHTPSAQAVPKQASPASVAPTRAVIPTSAASQAPAPPSALAEALHFSGTVNGNITAGINPRPHTTKMPHTLPDEARPFGSFPTSTQCADYSFSVNSAGDAHMWEAIVVGKINGQTYALELVVDKDRGAGVVGSHDTWIQNNEYIPTLLSQDSKVQQTRSSAGGTFTVNADERSGAIDLVVSKGLNEQAETHISGSWRCR
jgi:hypothetical protein